MIFFLARANEIIYCARRTRDSAGYREKKKKRNPTVTTIIFRVRETFGSHVVFLRKTTRLRTDLRWRAEIYSTFFFSALDPVVPRVSAADSDVSPDRRLETTERRASDRRRTDTVAALPPPTPHATPVFGTTGESVVYS